MLAYECVMAAVSMVGREEWHSPHIRPAGPLAQVHSGKGLEGGKGLEASGNPFADVRQ